jgi:hypothetical protein
VPLEVEDELPEDEPLDVPSLELVTAVVSPVSPAVVAFVSVSPVELEAVPVEVPEAEVTDEDPSLELPSGGHPKSRRVPKSNTGIGSRGSSAFASASSGMHCPCSMLDPVRHSPFWSSLRPPAAHTSPERQSPKQMQRSFTPERHAGANAAVVASATAAAAERSKRSWEKRRSINRSLCTRS